MVSKDKIKNFLFIFIFFNFLAMIIFISNVFSIKKKDYFEEEYQDLEKYLVSKQDLDNNFQDKNGPKIYINFWHNLYPKEQKILKKIIDVFLKKYPQIEVKDENKGNWNQIVKNIQSALTVDKQPHLVFSYPDHVKFYSKSEKVIPLDIFIEKDKNFKESDFLNNYLKKNHLEDYSSERKNSYFYFPFLKTTEIMFYNSYLLKKIYLKIQENQEDKEELNNLINQEGKIQEDITWKEMGTICRIIKKYKTKDFIPILVDSADNLFIINIEQRKNNDLKYPENRDELDQFFQNKNFHEIFEYFKKEFYDKKYLTFSQLCGEKEIENFILNENICFYITSNRRLEYSFNIPNFVPSISPLPQENKKNEEKKQKNIVQGPNINLFYSKNKDEMLASWLLLKHLTSFESYKTLLENGKIFNICHKINDEDIQQIEEIVEKNYSFNSATNQHLKEINTTIKDFFKKIIIEDAKRDDYFFISPIFENSNYLRTILKDLFVDIFSIKEISDVDLKERIKKIFKEAYERFQTN
ncbi:MAG: extracellular solute-binding protein [Candidatus Phytoplasma stylosanthis]|nr:extracellular solute-binding protein [Candidatus Phytoplasma stylosanthis]